MRLVLMIFVLAGAPLVAQDVDLDRRGDTPVEAKFRSGGEIHMDLCPSEVEVTGVNDSVIRVTYHPERENVRVRLRVSGDHADLRMSGCPSNNFHVRIEIPKATALHATCLPGKWMCSTSKATRIPS